MQRKWKRSLIKNTRKIKNIKRIKKNPAAKAVKLADIAHNCDFSRVNANNSVSQDKLEHWRNKYLAALKILEEQ